MKKNELVINTYVFLEQLTQGILQEELIAPLYELGITKVEIRREFIKDFDKELKAIREQAEQYNMELYYSVPGYIYKDGKVLEADIIRYFKEAKAMNCHRVKLCIGDCIRVEKEDVLKINQLCDEFTMLLTVENDQTHDNGRIDKIKKFLDDSCAFGSKILATFDIGNWSWQKENPIANAKILKQYIAYIHLKDVKGGDSPKTTLLDEGDIDWRTVIKELPQVPLALEYPCGVNVLEQLALEIKKVTE